MDKVLCLCRSYDQGGTSPKKVSKTGGVVKVQIPKKVSPKICDNQEGVANRAESVVEQPVAVETDVARRKSGQVITTLFSGGSLGGGNIVIIYQEVIITTLGDNGAQIIRIVQVRRSYNNPLKSTVLKWGNKLSPKVGFFD